MVAFVKKLPPWLAASALILILAIFSYIQVKNFVPAYANPDPDAYLWLAKRMARLEPLAVPSNQPLHFQEHMWVQTPANLITTKFAPGNSFLMVPFYLLFGDVGCFIMPLVASFLALIGAYLLFRRWMARFPSLIAVLALSFNPLFLNYSGAILPHAADLCLVTWGMYFLFKYLDRPALAAAIGAGLTLGFSLTVRPPDFLLALPLLAVGIIVFFRTKPRPIRHSIILLAAYALLPVALLIYNYVLFKNPLATGYALSNEQNGFYYQMLATNYPTYLEGLFQVGLFLFLPIGALGIIVLGPWQQRLVRILWIVPLSILCLSYYWFAPRIMGYRFIIALVPVFIGCAFALIDQVRATAWAKYPAMILLAALVLHHDRDEIKKFTTAQAHLGLTTQVEIGNFLAKNLSPNAVLFILGDRNLSPGTYGPYINQREHFDVYPLDIFEPHSLYLPDESASSLKRALRGLVPPRMQPARREYLLNFYNTHSAGELETLKLAIIQSAIDHHTQVGFMIPTYDFDSIEQSLAPRFKFKLLHSQSFPIYNPWQNDKMEDEDWSLAEVIPVEAPSGKRP